MDQQPGNQSGPFFDFRCYPTTTEKVLLMVPMTLIAILIIFGNSLVITAVLQERSLRTPKNIYFMSLAVADLLVGLFVIPVDIANQLNGWHWPFNKTLCEAFLTFGFYLSTVSIYHLVAVARYRCRIVSEGIYYIQDTSFQGVIAQIVAIYVFNVWLASPPLLGWGEGKWVRDLEINGACSSWQDPGYTLFASFGCFWMPTIVMLYYYVKLYRGIVRSRDRVLKQGTSQESGAGTKAVMLARERRAARTLAIVMSAFLICWLPFTIMVNVYSLCPHCPRMRACEFEVILWLGLFNSVLNPIIYTIFNVEFRSAFKKILCMQQK